MFNPHTTHTAASEVEEGMSLTNQLEELRKEGGDKWLAILNADKKKVLTVYMYTINTIILRNCFPELETNHTKLLTWLYNQTPLQYLLELQCTS